MFLVVWLVIFVLVFALEIYGVKRKQKNDTITETYRWIRDNLTRKSKALGFIFSLLISGLLMWTLLHFWDLV